MSCFLEFQVDLLIWGNMERRNRYTYGIKEGVDEHAFFSESSGPTRNFSASMMEDSWQLTPLTMSSSSSTSSRQSDYSYLQLQSLGDFSKQESKHTQHYFYGLGNESKYEMPLKLEKEQEPHKTIHRFFDEEPIRGRDCWLDPDDKSSNSSTTRLSISIPSSSNDFPPLSSRRDNGIRLIILFFFYLIVVYPQYIIFLLLLPLKI